MWFREDPNKKAVPCEGEKSSNSKNKSVKSPDDLRKTIAVLTVPRTHGGELVKLFREAETNIRSVCTTKVRVKERVGNTVKSLLTKSNPWIGENCPRQDCLPCQSKDKGFDCKRRGVTYMTSCNICQAQGSTTAYIGETSNSLYERAGQHLSDFKATSRESHSKASPRRPWRGYPTC